MKLLFENWRQFINEEVDPNATIRFEPTESPLEETNPELYRWLKKEKDIRMLRHLGHGAIGKVYEVEMPDGRRSALKVIPRSEEHTSPQIGRAHV